MSIACPACGNTLTEKEISGIVVDVCQGGCGGVWFDNFELEKVDEQHEHAGEELLDIERNPEVAVDYGAKRQCPRCMDITMMKHFFTVKRKVEIDECGNCGGFWLDAGELRDIRATFATEEDRKKAFDNYFNEVFGATLSAERQASQEELHKAQKIANAFKFICPSYYIPGKQDGAAF